LEAVDLIASHGWRLLPQYRFDAATAIWRHHLGLPEPPLSLWDVAYADGSFTHPGRPTTDGATPLADYLAAAEAILAAAPAPPVDNPVLDELAESLRWFVLGAELGV
jgi:hypothetical protein